jgi:pyridoxal phosphate enzyme (YggS family)
MAVTKFHPLETVEEAWNAGIRLFGESRVQEAVEKYANFWETHSREDGAELHLIGSLQRNKARTAVSFFDCVQSVDRDSIIEKLGVLTAELEKPLMVLLEYHTGEESKAGFIGMDSLFRAAEKTLSYPGLIPLGLMTMAPFTDDRAIQRASFRELAKAGKELEKRFPMEKISLENSTGSTFSPWSCLSMGMTNDFETAIEEGSTLIRIGSAIFGERIA